MTKHWTHHLLALILTSASLMAQADDNLLPPNQAFQVTARQVEGHTLEIAYTIAPGYYLYPQRFSFESNNPAVHVANVELYGRLVKSDPTEDEHYENLVKVRVTLSGANDMTLLKTRAQGCASVGVCYPPIVRTFTVNSKNT